MVVDTDEYVSVTNESEKESIAIINPDNLDSESDQLQDLPLATDRMCLFRITPSALSLNGD